MVVLVDVMLWFAVIAVGLMAGVYFTFSSFVMRSLDTIEKPLGMIAMQEINRVILRSVFLPIFFASSAACALLAVVAIVGGPSTGSTAMLAGGAIYVVGMFVVTVVANVPLNNALEATAARGPDGEAMWRRYMQRWTVWNHVRTLSCMASLALLVLALAERI
ncbi:MAG: DUF1772 domain-containing protein [Novosphingobium sp.]|nr:DUF1772 domain-containing protein [Novosphingobium sp.]